MPQENTIDSQMCVPQIVLSTSTHRPTEGILDVDSALAAETTVHDQDETEQSSHNCRDPYWGDGSPVMVPIQSAINKAIQSRTDLGILRRGQRSDLFLSKVKSKLLREELAGHDPNQRIREDYSLDSYYSLLYAPLVGTPLLVVHRKLTPYLTSLICAVHCNLLCL